MLIVEITWFLYGHLGIFDVICIEIRQDIMTGKLYRMHVPKYR